MPKTPSKYAKPKSTRLHPTDDAELEQLVRSLDRDAAWILRDLVHRFLPDYVREVTGKEAVRQNAEATR